MASERTQGIGRRTREPIVTLVQDDVHNPIGDLARIGRVDIPLEADEGLEDDHERREEG